MRRSGTAGIGAALLMLAACGGTAPSPEEDAARLVDPARVERTGRPNDFLVCPPDTCSATPDATSKVYDVPADQLAQAWLAVVSTVADARLLAADPKTRTFAFEQLSAMFRFTDTILVRFIELDPQRSTLVFYSRSETGYWDMGVNRQRGERWLQQLDYVLSTRNPEPAG